MHLMWQLISREIYNSKIVHLLVLKDFVNYKTNFPSEVILMFDY